MYSKCSCKPYRQSQIQCNCKVQTNSISFFQCVEIMVIKASHICMYSVYNDNIHILLYCTQLQIIKSHLSFLQWNRLHRAHVAVERLQNMFVLFVAIPVLVSVFVFFSYFISFFLFYSLQMSGTKTNVCNIFIELVALVALVALVVSLHLNTKQFENSVLDLNRGRWLLY